MRMQPDSENHIEKLCVICRASLAGRQSVFCSRSCKNAATNNKHQNYVQQQQRGRVRRRQLIELKGGCCEICGYKKNYAALSFHHLERSSKSFAIDLRKCSNATWNRLLAEAAKCRLLCLNCHAEVHNPDFST